MSLDTADNEPVRFWTYAISALNMLYMGAGNTSLALLRSPQPPAIETVLASLVNALVSVNSDVSEDTLLVLDDYHLIDAQPIYSALTFLLENLPPRLHLVITSRADPPLPLARLRARGALTELRAADLRFTPEEAAVFLEEILGFQLSMEDVAALDARTEGWVAGLQLAALAMKDRDDITGFIAGFTGSSRFIIDYLAEEVLERQPEDVRAFLLRTAILERMCAPLCDEVLGAEGESSPTDGSSQAMLEKLERSNLFIIALDDERGWYRYHHLFADVLRARLRQTRPGLLPALYRCAADWCEGEELVTEALRYALAGGDQDHAARIVEARALPRRFGQGDFATVREWFAVLPDTLIAAHPRLSYNHAAAIVITGDTASVERHLQTAEHGLLAGAAANSDLQAAITTLRGYMAVVQLGEPQRGLGLLRSALSTLPSEDAHRGLALYSLGELHIRKGDRL
ncbi:MAG TPA: helix-turn-helix transcriptional regulator, partial [Chloroflexia bacterium]|nr:helix-turn-helix transcriptional regulator [Chloroflexia bacterium]